MRRVDVLLAGNLCRLYGGEELARAGSGLGRLNSPVPYWEQLIDGFEYHGLDSILFSLCGVDFGKLNVRDVNDDW